MVDLFLTHEGDVALNTYGDLQLTDGIGEVLQAIAFRMKTPRGTYFLSPEIGHVLDALRGELLTPQSIAEGERRIYESLGDHVLFVNTTIEVRGAPVSENMVLFVIAVTYDGQHEFYTVPFDYTHGVVLPRTSTAPVAAIGAAPIEE